MIDLSSLHFNKSTANTARSSDWWSCIIHSTEKGLDIIHKLQMAQLCNYDAKMFTSDQWLSSTVMGLFCAVSSSLSTMPYNRFSLMTELTYSLQSDNYKCDAQSYVPHLWVSLQFSTLVGPLKNLRVLISWTRFY